MRNRLRMIVASFLTKHLLIDYHDGEHYFEQHLADANLAANNGGWQIGRDYPAPIVDHAFARQRALDVYGRVLSKRAAVSRRRGWCQDLDGWDTIQQRRALRRYA